MRILLTILIGSFIGMATASSKPKLKPMTSAEKKEWREVRHARELVFQSCISSCNITCSRKGN